MRLLAVPSMSLLAACLTPAGPSLVMSQVAVAGRSAFIGEWAPTSFRVLAAQVTALMLMVVAVLWARRGSTPWTELLIFVLAAALTAYAVRTVSLGAVLAAPLLAGAAQALLASPAGPISRREAVGVAAAGTAVAGLLAALVPSTSASPGNVPDGLAKHLAALPRGSAVMVDGTVGSWIEWRFPELHPTMDGMFDAYSIEYMERYQAARDLRPGWRDFLDETGADVAVLSRDGAFQDALTHQGGWNELASDGRWVLLMRDGVAPSE
jgi:hypothetical protein